MHLTDRELFDLADFLARRLALRLPMDPSSHRSDTPHSERPEMPTGLWLEITPIPSVSPTESVDETVVGAWRTTLLQAREADRLAALLRAAARRLPCDLALQEALSMAFVGGQDGASGSEGAFPSRVEAPSALSILAIAGGLLFALVLLSFATTGTLAAVEALQSSSPNSSMARLAAQGEPRETVKAVPPSQGMGDRVPIVVEPLTVPIAPPADLPAQPLLGVDVFPASLGHVPMASTHVPMASTHVPMASTHVPMASTHVPIANGVVPSVPVVVKAPVVKAPVAASKGARSASRKRAIVVGTPALDAPCKEDGWFYAGREAPDTLYIVPHPVRVREEPPTKDNGWDSRTPVRCYLAKGDLVRQARAPMALPGGHYWVYVDPKRVERPDDVASADTGHTGDR